MGIALKSLRSSNSGYISMLLFSYLLSINIWNTAVGKSFAVGQRKIVQFMGLTNHRGYLSAYIKLHGSSMKKSSLILPNLEYTLSSPTYL